MESTCAFSDCAKPVRKRGWCYTHYSRWYRHGDPAYVQPRVIGVAECSIDDCDGTVFARGWCVAHWTRWRRYGDPFEQQRIRGDLTARFWSKVSKTDTCWLWTGTLNRKGYGQIWDGRIVNGAHRVAYTLLVGPIPDGLQLDHLCRVVACVNPEHLEPVTGSENSRRMHAARGHQPSLPVVKASQ